MRLLVMLSWAQNERQTTNPLCHAAKLRCEGHTVTVADDIRCVETMAICQLSHDDGYEHLKSPDWLPSSTF